MLRVVMQLKMKGRRPRLRWVDNIDRHHKGNKTSKTMKVSRTKGFENTQDWRTLISRSNGRNSGEDP